QAAGHVLPLLHEEKRTPITEILAPAVQPQQLLETRPDTPISSLAAFNNNNNNNNSSNNNNSISNSEAHNGNSNIGVHQITSLARASPLHNHIQNHRRHSDSDFLAAKGRRECRLASDPGYTLEPLFADLGTLSAHREEDEDFGAFLEENPEFFVDFGDDPFEDVPSTSVEEHEHHNSTAFVFDTKVHQNECRSVEHSSTQFGPDTVKTTDEPVAPVSKMASMADPPEGGGESNNAEPPAPEDLLLCKAIDFGSVTDERKAEAVVDGLVVKPDVVLMQDLKNEPVNDVEVENKTPPLDPLAGTGDANGPGDADEAGEAAPQETVEPPPIKKLKPKPSPLCITQPQMSGTTTALNSPTPYQSLLRSPLLATAPHSPPPYTPPPMLSPCRKATGLFSSIDHVSKAGWSFGPPVEAMIASDVVPHVNIGPQYQAAIPTSSSASEGNAQTAAAAVAAAGAAAAAASPTASEAPPRLSASEVQRCEASTSNQVTEEGAADGADLLWKPEFAQHINDAHLDQYISVACSSLVPCGGGGRNHELAYHILALCHGDLDAAVQLFLRGRRGFALPAFHPLLTYKYQESESWSTKQLDAFQTALIAHGKDFGLIADKVSGKDVKACIEMYYFWKKVCPEEYRRLRQGRKRKSTALPETVERCESCSRCACKGVGCALCGDCCGPGRGLGGGDEKDLQASHYFPCKSVRESQKPQCAHEATQFTESTGGSSVAARGIFRNGCRRRPQLHVVHVLTRPSDAKIEALSGSLECYANCPECRRKTSPDSGTMDTGEMGALERRRT
ncbi:hypothetical protein BIW11_09198, partial [Tropilaelaps mercedesae]